MTRLPDAAEFALRPGDIEAMIGRSRRRRLARLGGSVCGGAAVVALVLSMSGSALAPQADNVDLTQLPPSPPTVRHDVAPVADATPDPAPSGNVAPRGRQDQPALAQPAAPSTVPGRSPIYRRPDGGGCDALSIPQLGNREYCARFNASEMPAKQGGGYHIAYSICTYSLSEDSGKLSFAGAPEVDLFIRRAGSTTDVWRWTRGQRLPAGGAHELPMVKDRCYTWTHHLDLVDQSGARLPKGSYEVYAQSTAAQHTEVSGPKVIRA